MFLKRGMLVSQEMLDTINDEEHISRIFNALKSKQAGEAAVIDMDLKRLVDEAKTQKSGAETPQHSVKVVQSYTEEPKKREPQDFVDYFNNRYKAIEKILKQRQELKSTVSINKIAGRKEKDSAAIIGMVATSRLQKTATSCFCWKTQQARKKFW